LLVAATFLGYHRRVADSRITFRCNGGQPYAEALERVVPACITREWIEAEDFAVIFYSDL